VFVSVTRLRLRGIRFVLGFMYYTMAASTQVKNSAGCSGVRLRKTRGLTFWTLTMWATEQEMKSFRAQSPHREAMPKLAHWCDEASVAHWLQETNEWPSWEKCAEQLASAGRLSKVKHPSADHARGIIAIT
jgi:hypothetical protein